eukprot:scaffold29456_cov59-Attheya_sp.AAC.2
MAVPVFWIQKVSPKLKMYYKDRTDRRNTGTKGTDGMSRVSRAFQNWSGWPNLTGAAKVTAIRVGRAIGRDI